MDMFQLLSFEENISDCYKYAYSVTICNQTSDHFIHRFYWTINILTERIGHLHTLHGDIRIEHWTKLYFVISIPLFSHGPNISNLVWSSPLHEICQIQTHLVHMGHFQAIWIMFIYCIQETRTKLCCLRESDGVTGALTNKILSWPVFRSRAGKSLRKTQLRWGKVFI